MEEGQRLLERILDGADDPSDLPFALFQDITDNFSPERKIGEGGFGEVYKGVLGGRTVAVKRIHINVNTFDDKLFRREATSLMKINHRNVVRFLGLCSQGYQKLIDVDQSGKYIWVNVFERLLCFEYISNGSLDKHITDELRGLEWEARYEIIIGICKGLHYLHTERGIIHMDLKPENILLDHQYGKYMVPKITDFGLSRPNENSHTMGKSYGTRGYSAPEYMEDSKTTPACDIYSLGLIIIELVTGCKDTPHKNNVLRRWRHRWSKPPTQLRYQQVTRCIEIAGRCRMESPEARPSISKIISFLVESEITFGPIIPCLDKDDMLRINPLELHMPSELKNEMSHSIELTNDTLNCIAFNIQSVSARPVKGIVPPGCTYVVTITMQARDIHEHDHVDKFTMQSIKWNEGHGQDIIEYMSHAETRKFIDEVDLMVVYKTTEPQENCKLRGDTSKIAKYVPKTKKREIGESSSGKGTDAEDISSNNLHPLWSFSRHYPTNTKYLEKESDRAVDHARGALGSLLHKLGILVTEDYRLKTSINTNIKSFSEDITIILRDLPGLDNVKGAKIWLDDVRELSYHIEDMVDSFLVHVEPNCNEIGFRELTHKGLKIWEKGMMNNHDIGDVITDIKNQVHDVVDRKNKYNFDVNNVLANAANKAAIEDLRISAINVGIEQLVGIEAPRDELIGLFGFHGNISKQNLKVFSIVGHGGLGKTTLANAVYEKLEQLEDYTSAFVVMGRNPVLNVVLKKIIIGFKNDFSGADWEVWRLCKKLRELLNKERYLILIDDIWDSSDWEIIKHAFPENGCGGRVITTTRDRDVALACCNGDNNYVYSIKPLSEEDSKILFFRRTNCPEEDCPNRLKYFSVDILKTCGGMPLAINSIASLLAGKTHATWEYVWKSLGALIKGNNDVGNMMQILDLSYIHLPEHLKTCLLYVCKYPEDWEIDKNDLLRQWIAEGFVHVCRGSRLDAEDIAEDYFRKLISMCMLEPGKIDFYSNEVLSCRVHDIILDLIRSKSSEEKFIHVIDGLKDVSGHIRRVSVHSNDKEDCKILETIKGSLSHVRSVLLYRPLLLPAFLKHKYVRVLHIEDKVFSKATIDLTCISSLFFLRYLKIACYKWSNCELVLPHQIGQLQQLETIDLEGCELKNYPSDIITLPWLSHLRYSSRFEDIMFPEGIERLKSLCTLVGVCLSNSSAESIEGLAELTNLRNLEICAVWFRKSDEEIDVRMNALHSSISRLATSLRILSLEAGLSRQHNVSRWSRTLFPQGSRIGKLHLSGFSFQRCPEWIGQLHHLYSLSIRVREVAGGISIVKGLPSLAYLELCTSLREETEQESVVISGDGAFKSLKHLIFDCVNAPVSFEKGALPKLEILSILLHMYRSFLPIGMQHLPTPTLKQIYLRFVEGDRDGHRQQLVKNLLDRANKERHPGAAVIYVQFQSADKYSEQGGYQVEPIERQSGSSQSLDSWQLPCSSMPLYLETRSEPSGQAPDWESLELPCTSSLPCYLEMSQRKSEFSVHGDEDFIYNEHDYYHSVVSESVDDEEADNETGHQVNGSQTYGEAHCNTWQFVQLIEEQKDSHRMGIETDAHAPRLLDTRQFVHQSGHTENLESLQLPITSLTNQEPCLRTDTVEPVTNFTADINNDLSVEQGKNGMSVNSVKQHLHLHEAPNQLSDEEYMELSEDDVEPARINCSSSIHGAVNLCFTFLLRIQAICNSCLRS